ncbi:hypothetical protein ITP53_51385, partial [Nonomuraea sp. K274]|nr:hypothetical protein [Nonomuraea cypriaca]
MRRGWVIAGVLILAAVPSVPVAAVGVSLVIEQVKGSEGAGKWLRTGDVQRFRVRLSGMAKGVKVAVAANPVEALSGVACVPRPTRVGVAPLPAADGPSSGTSGGMGSGSGIGSGQGAPGVGESAAGVAAEGGPGEWVRSAEAPAGGGVVAAGALAARAMAVASGSAFAGGAALASKAVPGARVCALGRLSGSRAVDVTLTAPVGADEVALATVARMRAASGGTLTTLSRTAAMRVGRTATGEAATSPSPVVRERRTWQLIDKIGRRPVTGTTGRPTGPDHRPPTTGTTPGRTPHTAPDTHASDTHASDGRASGRAESDGVASGGWVRRGDAADGRVSPGAESGGRA